MSIDIQARLNDLDITTKRKIIDLCCRLSPENLCCDGELPRYMVDQKRLAIMKEWREIERKHCIQFSEMDVPIDWWGLF